MKNINFNIIKSKKTNKKIKLKNKNKIKCKRGEFENFPISVPPCLNFLNETSLGIEKNKRVGSGWDRPVPNPPVVIPSSVYC